MSKPRINGIAKVDSRWHIDVDQDEHKEISHAILVRARELGITEGAMRKIIKAQLRETLFASVKPSGGSVDLDDIDGAIVDYIAQKENVTASKAVSNLIRRHWRLVNGGVWRNPPAPKREDTTEGDES